MFRIGPRQAIAAVQQAAEGSKKTLQQVLEVADPRTIAAGLAGLTIGEMVGGAVGSLVGIVVAGPPGAVVGSQIGAFTTGMVGLKLGTEVVYVRLQAQKDDRQPAQRASSTPVTVGGFLRKKTGERVGELAGLTSGATLGLIVAGPVGGLVGAVVGEAVGGQLGEDATRSTSGEDNAVQLEQKPAGTQWLDRLGKNTVGESVVILAGGTIGSLFGPSGRALGQRIGIIVGKRVEWHKLDVGGMSGSGADRDVPTADVEPLWEDAVPLEVIALTEPELEVLALYATGMSDAVIAARLNVRPAIASRYIRMVCRKLDVSTPEEAATLTTIFMSFPNDSGNAPSR